MIALLSIPLLTSTYSKTRMEMSGTLCPRLEDGCQLYVLLQLELWDTILIRRAQVDEEAVAQQQRAYAVAGVDDQEPAQEAILAKKRKLLDTVSSHFSYLLINGL
jgi:hypothetical protein